MRLSPAALCILLAASCNPPGRVDLRLRAPDGTDLESVGTLSITLATEPDGVRVVEGEARGADLEELATVFRRADLDPGHRYVFEVRADASDETCSSERLVGRSLPFEVDSNDSEQTVTTYVACADAFARTEGAMQDARSILAAVWDDLGAGAVLMGGASRVVLVPGEGTTELTALDSVERYDVATGEFSSEEVLTMPRVTAAAEILDEGEIVVLGGIGSGEGGILRIDALDAVEVLEGATRKGLVNLTNRWIETNSLRLNDGTIAIVGAGYDSGLEPAQAEVYDAAQSRNVASLPSLFDPAQRWESTVVPFDGRDRALIVGGVVSDGSSAIEGAPPPELFEGSSRCDDVDAPCLRLVDEGGDTAGFGPGESWKGLAGAWVPCASGGGTAYLIGGEIGPEGSRTQVPDIFCFRDEPGADPEPLLRIGDLRSARAGAMAVLVRGSRILVVGGTRQISPVDTAELFRVDACTCEQQIAPDDIAEVHFELAFASALLRPTLLPLGDGTVLVAGSVDASGDESRIDLTATSDAWIFAPDLD